MTDDLKKTWRDEAACVDELDLFFSGNWRDWQKAKNICAGCPVRRTCLVDALEHEDRFGVWGGLDHYQLRTTLSIDKKGDAIPRKTPPRCPYCNSKDIEILEKKRVRIHYSCTICDLAWWSRRAPVKRESKSDNVDPAVPAGNEEG